MVSARARMLLDGGAVVATAAGTYLPLTAELERRATEQWPGFAEFLGREDTG